MKQKSKTKISTPIHLKNVGMDIRIVEKSLKKAKIKTTLQGIEISVPTGKGKRRHVIMFTLNLFSFIAIGIIGIIFILELVLSLLGRSSEPIDWLTITCSSLYLICQGPLILKMWNQGLYEEKIVLSKKTLKIGNYIFRKCKLRIEQENTYDIMNISNLRLALQEHRLQEKGTICFEYGNRTIGFCKNVGATEATMLLKHLSAIIAFRCYSVEHIIFGTSSLNNNDPYTTLHNPDVSDLNIPFVCLKQVVIHTETYDFHLVERFLTYAVNYIGQDYLKEHVEVIVYGGPKKLHPNLRNSFDNLCKRVQVHKELTK